MSIAKLQAAHKKFQSDGIAIYVPAVRIYMAAVEDHLNESAEQPIESAPKTPSA
jgi:hypothetical protein